MTWNGWDFAGDEVVYGQRRRDGVHVLTYSPEEGESSLLLRIEGGGGRDLALSPDRRRVLFSRTDHIMSDVFLIGLPTTL